MNLNQYSDQELQQIYRNVVTKNRGLEARLQSTKSQSEIELGIKELNDKTWPFWFVTPGLTLVTAGNVVNTNINVTNEAAFVVTSVSKVVYRSDGGDPVFIDGDRKSAGGLLPDVGFQIADSSSSRKWSQRPIHMNVLGTAEKPWVLDNPFFLAPNHNLSVEFYNNSQEEYYMGLIFQGYRFKDALIDRLASFVTE